MEEYQVKVGTIQGIGNGAVNDNRRPVTFTGEQLASRTVYGEHNGRPSDTRGVTETLYKVEDGRLVVFVEDWSRWSGEASYYSLHAVTEDDLGANGQFELLGIEAGMGRPLTLDEALARGEQPPPE